MPTIAASDLSFVQLRVNQFEADLQNSLYQSLTRIVAPAFFPEELKKFSAEIRVLQDRLSSAINTASQLEITNEEAALLRQIVLKSRLRDARWAEGQSLMTFHPELLDHLWSGVAEYDAIISREWFRQASHRALPRLSDFVPIEYAQTPTWQTANPEKKQRQFDEKFHILQAPALFISDLDEFREASDLRALSFAVAFIDIDDFKKLNSKYTETITRPRSSAWPNALHGVARL